MFKRQVSPIATGIATLLLLAVVQFVYWRLLVYREPVPPGGGGGGGPMTPVPLAALGRADVPLDTLAGGGPGYVDGPGWQARFSGPAALAPSPGGGVYVADSRNHRIRRVSPDGTVTTVAGGGEPGGPGGKGEGPALVAELRYPSGVAVTPDGRLFIADTGNHRILRLDMGRLVVEATLSSSLLPGPLVPAADGKLWTRDLASGRVLSVNNPGASVPPPGPVAAALGDGRVGSRPGKLWAYGDEAPTPLETEYALGSWGAALSERTGFRVVGDLQYHVLLGIRDGDPPFLLAGRRDTSPAVQGVIDGTGAHCRFGTPCATVLSADGTLYVADYETDRIRRLRLPDWLLSGTEAPLLRRGRLGRERRGG